MPDLCFILFFSVCCGRCPLEFGVMSDIFFYLLFLCFGLSSCISLSLVDNYDPEIEKNVNLYHKSAVSFVATAVEKKQKFTAPSVAKFYSEQSSLLRNLLINAQVSASDTACPISFLQNNTAIIPENLKQDIIGEGDNSTGINSCTYITLNHLYNTHLSLQEIHKENITIKGFAANFSLSLIEDAVRIV